MVWPFSKRSKVEAPPERNAKTRVRYYKAAKNNRLTAGWLGGAKHPDQIINENLEKLRGRSREQFANNDYMRRFVQLTRSNVVGPRGMQLLPKSVDTQGNPDKEDNKAVEQAFMEWQKRGQCEISGQLCFRDIERLFIATVVVDGEFLAREFKGVGDHGYQLQLIDPEHLDVSHNNDKLPGGNFIRFSIEFTKNGKPVAYYLRDDTSSIADYVDAGRKYVRVPADQIIHCFIPERIGQKRGIPAAATALLRMNMLDGYEEAAVIAARTGASTMGFFTRNADGMGFEGADEEDEEMITEIEPGVFEELPEGVDFKSFDPDYPHAQYAEFVKRALRGISSGLGLSYHSLANDLEGVNYTSSRTGQLEDREEWKGLQEWAIECFYERVYLGWLPNALNLGKITSSTGKPLPSDRLEKYRRHTWQGRRWAWVDPLKDIQASKIAVEAGLSSRSQIIRENGRDPDEVWQELEAEAERLQGIIVMGTEEVLTDDEGGNSGQNAE